MKCSKHIFAKENSLLNKRNHYLLSTKMTRLVLKILVTGLVVMVVSLFLFPKSHWFPNRAIAASITLSSFQNPMAGVSINIDRVHDLLKTNTELKDVPEDLIDTIKQLRKLDIHTLDFFLFPPDKDYNILPVVALRGDQKGACTRLLSDNSPWASYAQKQKTEDQYRLRKGALPEKDWDGFPVETYRIRQIKGDCFIGPEPLLNSLPAGYDLIAQSPVSQFTRTLNATDNVAEIAIRLPVNFINDLQTQLNEHPFIKEHPLTEIMTDMVMTWYRQLFKPFEQLQYMALGIQINGDNRYLRYTQLFQPSVDGAAVYETLKNGKADTGPDIISSMASLLANPLFSVKPSFKENLLGFDIAWEQANDQPVIEALIEATLGNFFERAMLSGEPTLEPISTSYTSAPQLTSQINIPQVKKRLPDQISTNLFPGSFWQDREEPKMDIILDPVAIPNAELAKVEYEVLRINASDGRNVHRPTEELFPPDLQLDDKRSSRIRLNILPDTQAQDLSTALIRFKISIPSDLYIFDFKADTPEKTKEKDGILIVAERIDKDIAEIYNRGCDKIWLFAYDKTGKAISAKESISGSGGMFKRFSGIIDRLQVVAARRIIEQSFDIKVDLNEGREIELSHTPQLSPRTRLEYSPEKNHSPLSVEELANLKVEWFKANADPWDTAGLKIRLANGPISGNARWEAYFFGADDKQIIKGYSYSTHTHLGYKVTQDKLSNAQAAFGKVSITAAGKIETLQFDYQGDKTFEKQYLSTGDEIALAFHLNEIAYQNGNIKVTQIKAFNAENRQLKQDNYYSNREGTVFQYFWGIPKRVELEIATNIHERTLNFDLPIRSSVRGNTYEEFKRDIEHRREITNILKHLFQIRQQNPMDYGEDLVGFFYLAEKESNSAIDRAVAFSDPKGESRFAYLSQPYKGYHFTVLPLSEKHLLSAELSNRDYTYGDQSFKALPVQILPALAAIPTDKSAPTFFISQNRVYMKYLNGEPLSQVPDNYYSNSGWHKVELL